MKRKLIVLDVLLVGAIAGMGWQFREQWTGTEKKQQAVLRKKVNPAPPPPMSPLPPVQPSTAASYGEVAQKMLFTKDRNPVVVVEVAPPKPMPPLPGAYGVMDLGDGATAFLSEKPGAGSKPYKAGETIGEFKLVALNKDEITFEWDGKTIHKKVEELRVTSLPPAQAQQAAAAPAAPRPSAAVTSVSSGPVKNGPGDPTGPTTRRCVPGDTSAAGAVVEGYKKLVISTPFGQSCRWEAER